MAIIRVKRKTGSPGIGTDLLKEGEIGISGSYFGWGPNSGNDFNVIAKWAAVQNDSNVFSQSNVFTGEDLTIKIVNSKKFSIQNNSGTETYFAGPDGYLRTNISNNTLTGTMLVNANYVDEKLQGLDVKQSVRAASTSNIPGTYTTTNGGTFTFSSAGVWVLDGVTVAKDDRVLLKNQTDHKNNGIYIVKTLGTSSVATVLERAKDANTFDELKSAFVFVQEGSANADTGWTCTSDVNGSSTPPNNAVLPWTQFSGAGTYKADGTSLKLTGNEFGIIEGAVTDGDFSVSGQFAVGSGSETWTIQDIAGSGDLVFKKGSYTATLVSPGSNKTIAYTTDIPSTTGIFDVSGSSTARTATVPNFTLSSGAQLFLKFTSASTASNTLQINGGTIYPILLNGSAITAGAVAANGIVRTYFNGTNFLILENFAERKYYGTSSKATALETARNLKVSLSATGTATFDGSANQEAIPVTGVLGIGNGGTGQSSKTAAFNALSPTTTLGDIIFHNGANNVRLGGETTTTRKFLRSAGSGTSANAPAWDTVTKTDVGLSNVENTALSTWAGTTNITTLGTITTGTWSGSTIAVNKGGTGTTSHAADNILVGNGASAIKTVGPKLTVDTMTFGAAGNIKSTTTSAMTLDSGTTGAVNVGTGANSKTVTIGNTTGSTTVNINTGTGNLNISAPTTNFGGGSDTWSISDSDPSENLKFSYSGAGSAFLPKVANGTTRTIAYTSDTILSPWVGNSSVAAGIAAKTASITNFTYKPGAFVYVTFEAGNTVANATLNINSLGAKNIFYNGSAVTTGNFTIEPNTPVLLYYNGTQFDIVSIGGGSGGFNYYSGTSSTAIGTAAKTMALAGYTLKTGNVINVTFSTGNSVATATLNIQSTGAKNITIGGSNVTTSNFTIDAGSIVQLYYTGSTYEVISIITNRSAAKALSSSGTSLVTEKTVYYGLPTINGSHNYTSNTNIYAPTAQLASSNTKSYLVGALSRTSISTVYSNSSVYMTSGVLYATEFDGLIDGGSWT